MAVLRAMDGKFYDVPDDQASKFEIPRDQVKTLLEKSGAPGPQGGGAPSGPPGGPPGSSGQVIVQIFAGGGQSAGGPGGAPPPSGGGEGGGEVDPYWWWRNFVPSWGNYWPNY
jgi:hypothetical protein